MEIFEHLALIHIEVVVFMRCIERMQWVRSHAAQVNHSAVIRSSLLYLSREHSAPARRSHLSTASIPPGCILPVKVPEEFGILIARWYSPYYYCLS